MTKLKLSPSIVVAMIALFVALTGTGVAVVTSLPSTQEIAHAVGTTHLRISALPSDPQTILTLPAAQYNGSPVVIHLSIDYINFIPDGTASCGIGFVLYDADNPVAIIGLFGAHYSIQNQFAPIELSDVLEGARTPTAGVHTFSVRVWKWSPSQDGYIVAGTGINGDHKPMRLSAAYN